LREFTIAEIVDDVIASVAKETREWRGGFAVLTVKDTGDGETLGAVGSESATSVQGDPSSVRVINADVIVNPFHCEPRFKTGHPISQCVVKPSFHTFHVAVGVQHSIRLEQNFGSIFNDTIEPVARETITELTKILSPDNERGFPISVVNMNDVIVIVQWWEEFRTRLHHSLINPGAGVVYGGDAFEGERTPVTLTITINTRGAVGVY
jgi:hypothetical protein